DGERLTTDRHSGGRRFRLDPRCLAGEPVRGAFAHVCAVADPSLAIRFDEPEMQQVRRDALAWWIPLLGDELVCLTTLVLDASHYGGAITVATSPLLRGRSVRADLPGDDRRDGPLRACAAADRSGDRALLRPGLAGRLVPEPLRAPRARAGA